MNTGQTKLRYPAFESPKYSSKLKKVSPHRGDPNLSFKLKTQKAELNKKADFASFRSKTLIFKRNGKAKLFFTMNRSVWECDLEGEMFSKELPTFYPHDQGQGYHGEEGSNVVQDGNGLRDWLRQAKGRLV